MINTLLDDLNNEYSLLDKGYKGLLVPGLHSSEFHCKCELRQCSTTLVYRGLLVSYMQLRQAWGNLLIINSGYRCQSHNGLVGGTDFSRHMRGQAIDIRPANMDDLSKLKDLAKQYFDIVLEYDTFIHCHKENK